MEKVGGFALLMVRQPKPRPVSLPLVPAQSSTAAPVFLTGSAAAAAQAVLQQRLEGKSRPDVPPADGHKGGACALPQSGGIDIYRSVYP